MKQIPILMSPPMVKAIMNTKIGLPILPIDTNLPFKGMTRRTRGLEELNINPNDWRFTQHGFENKVHEMLNLESGKRIVLNCPYGKNGDILWVRETAREVSHYGFDYPIIEYKAGGNSAHCEIPDEDQFIPMSKWKPSIHMPKSAARIWLRNTGSRIQRLHQITALDCYEEGILSAKHDDRCVKEKFMELWISINGWDSWNHNPWVWVVGFQVISKTGKPDMEICEACNETNLVSEMRMDTEEANWYCAKCWNEMEASVSKK